MPYRFDKLICKAQTAGCKKYRAIEEQVQEKLWEATAINKALASSLNKLSCYIIKDGA